MKTLKKLDDRRTSKQLLQLVLRFVSRHEAAALRLRLELGLLVVVGVLLS